MSHGYNYNVSLPNDVSEILDKDFWVLEHVTPQMLELIHEPVKFAASTWIFINKGRCEADISLISYEIEAPALVIVKNSHILMPKYISPDFDATALVMSKRFQENLFMFMANTSLYTLISRHVCVKIPEHCVPDVKRLFTEIQDIVDRGETEFGSKAIFFTYVAFIYKTVSEFYLPYKNEIVSNQGRMSDQFLALAQEHFKKQRFLDFYAAKLEVTPKHLSRTVKNQTGYTAVEWIERFVILEAKVLLKSSNLNIQQISDELNFPSQSFFGKYFKKYTGMSPKEFRNS